MANGTQRDGKDPLRTTASRFSVMLREGTQDLNLKQLYYFHAIATEGTIARAAKRLKLSQATISEQLKNLETYLETPLVERRTTGVRLNQHGRRVFEHTTVMFRAVHRMLQDINPARARDRWVLEVGVCPTVSRTFAVQKFLPLFELRDVALRIRQLSYDSMINDVLTGELDLMISENRPTEHEEQKLAVEVLSASPMIFVASADFAKRVTDFPKDLGDLPFVAYSSASIHRYEVDRFLIDEGLAPEVLGEVDDVTLMAHLAASGSCFAAVPQSVSSEYVRRGDLVELGEVAGSQARVYACYQSTKTPETVIRAVRALLGSPENSANDTETTDNSNPA